MSTESESHFTIRLSEKKSIILTLCSDFLTNKLNELTIEKSFTNTNLLLLLDDLMDSLYSLISSQIKQLPSEIEEAPNLAHCVNRVLTELKNTWDANLEKIATKIVKSQMNEKTIFQMFNYIEKSEKNMLKTIFHSLEECLTKVY